MQEELSERLKNLRKTAGLSQTEFADKLNMHVQTISKWERGISEPDIAQMSDISAVLGISLEKLFGAEEGEQTFAGNFSAERLGEYIASLRTQQNESQQQLAELCASSADAVSRWERGVTCPDAKDLKTLSEHFNVPVSKLYYAVSDEVVAPTVVTGGRNRKTVAILASALAVATVAAATFLTVFLLNRPTEGQAVPLTVTVDGVEQIVNQNEWYTPQAANRTGYDFLGWRDAEGNDVTVPYKVTADCELISVYAPHEYTVNYWLNGGSFEESVCNTFTVETGKLVLPIPKKDGAIFGGWYTVPDYSQDAVTSITCNAENVHLYAKWESIFYTVTVDGIEQTVALNEWYTPQVANRTGYDFVGWRDAEGNDVAVPYKVTADCEFISIYTPHEYHIEYWLNGGTFATAEVQTTFTVESGEVELPTVQKQGSAFEGWYLTNDYSGSAVSSVVCDAQDIKLYAKWSDETYTVRYELGGGTLYESNPQYVTLAQEVTLNAPLRKGYLFLGWYDAQTGGNRVEVVGGKNASNLTLYAQWQKSDAVFTVNYELNGGTQGAGNPTTVKAGDMFVLAAPEKRGHDFLGWNDRADGTGDFMTKVFGNGENVFLYAVFTPKEYMLRYLYEGLYLTDEVNPNYVTFGQSITLIPVYRYGYDFLGWYDSESGGNPVAIIDESNLPTLTTLYARFAIKTYAVTLNGDGGTFVTPEGERGTYCCLLPFNGSLTLPEAFREGYDFLGWQNEAGERVEKLNIQNIAEMSLTATWREKNKTYRITFETNGGVLENGNVAQMLCGETVALPVPERDGYLFLGWNDKADESGAYHDLAESEWQEDLTLYAVWQEIKINGSSEFFGYTKGAESVTITKYLGDYGENVRVNIPAVIEGLPVTEVNCLFGFGSTPSKAYKSITIPEGVTKLGENSLRGLVLSEPLYIPATVSELGKNCFYGIKTELYFADDGKLETVSVDAFNFADIPNVIVLPKTVKTIKIGAFASAYLGGIILPDGLSTIEQSGLELSEGCVYIPSSVNFIGMRACTNAYISLSREQIAERAFHKDWVINNAVYNHTAHKVVLEDGEWKQEIVNEYIQLPKREKQGYRFLGWQNEAGEFVRHVFIPEVDCTLYAVYEEITPNNGLTQATAIHVKPNESFSFTCRGNETFYFIIDTEEDISCSIRCSLSTKFTYIPGSFGVALNSSFTYHSGTIMKYKNRPVPLPITFTVRVLQL